MRANLLLDKGFRLTHLRANPHRAFGSVRRQAGSYGKLERALTWDCYCSGMPLEPFPRRSFHCFMMLQRQKSRMVI